MDSGLLNRRGRGITPRLLTSDRPASVLAIPNESLRDTLAPETPGTEQRGCRLASTTQPLPLNRMDPVQMSHRDRRYNVLQFCTSYLRYKLLILALKFSAAK